MSDLFAYGQCWVIDANINALKPIEDLENVPSTVHLSIHFVHL